MANHFKILTYLVVLLFSCSSLVACFDDAEDIDITLQNDLVLTNVVFGSLKTEVHTKNKAGEDSLYYSSISASAAYPFTIDQLNNVAYNLDSLPASVCPDKIIFSAFTVNSGTCALRKLTAEEDTLYATTDTIDFTPGFRTFNLYGADGTSRRSYRIEVRIHKQREDSVTWRQYDRADWKDEFLQNTHNGTEYSVAGEQFRLDDGKMLLANAEGEFAEDRISADEAQYLPTANHTWVSAPSRVDKELTELILYGTQQQGDSLVGRLWRRYIDPRGDVEAAWEYLPAVFDNTNRLPDLHDASLFFYDKGFLLVGLTNAGHLSVKYSLDRGRTWKKHRGLVPSADLNNKTITSLKAGLDADNNLWLLIDDNEVWYGRAHAVGWAEEQRAFLE